MADGLMSIFDKWTDLDPALALKRIEEAHGSAIFTKYSYLDPQRAVVEIEDALGIELDNTAFNFSQLEDDIDAAVGDLPALPEGSHYIVNADGKYLVNADGAYILADGV